MNVYDFAKKQNICITEEIVSNLASVFFTDAIFNLPQETRDAVIAIYKVLNFEYNNIREILVYRGVFKNFFLKEKTKNPWKITPYRLNKWDQECIENILNSGKYQDLLKLSPIFDAIGFILSVDETQRYVLHFIGSKDYEIWKEVDPVWNEDFNMENCNWREGSFQDGIDLTKAKFTWKPEEDIYGEA